LPTINELADSLTSYLAHQQINQVRRAYYYAEQAHEGQRRRTGEPYIIHPLAVASILCTMRMDHQALMAAMLHDVIEDTGVSKQAISRQFGDTVAKLVDGVSKFKQIQFQSRELAQAENFQKMALAMAQDIRVILIKLADRLHNMRTLNVLPQAKRSRIAKETLDIYAPIAGRLGINHIRLDMEELGFANLYPLRWQLISSAIKTAQTNRQAVMNSIQVEFQQRLAELKLTAEVEVRQRHAYSIYKKMKTKGKSFNDIMDVFGFCLTVNNIEDSYRALGAVHNLYKPIPGRFRDYIAIPRANGYQALHTTLIGKNGIPIEVHIRSKAMAVIADKGITGHWLQAMESGGQTNKVQNKAQEWVQGVVELQQRVDSSLEFIEHLKADLFPDEVYIFTPKGRIFVLPAGATPVDFAYAVHTDIGNNCIACKINRRLSSLTTPLQSGQTVEIITAASARPNATWLNFVITGKARSNIRHFLKSQQRSESIQLGQRLVDKYLASFNTSLSQIADKFINLLLKETGFANLDDLLEDVGLGNRMAQLVARRLLSLDDTGPAKLLANSENHPLSITGTEGMIIRYADCCHPIPGDTILGYLAPGEGVTIHVDGCKTIDRLRQEEPDKYFHASWADSIEGNFVAELRLEFRDSPGVLALVASAMTNANANINAANVQAKDGRYSSATISLQVTDRVHLARVMRKLRKVAAVTRVMRARGQLD
jgi:guanosine-3',5'-bis(diphosphate) 3'-pyrophosphohydrolase